MKCTTVHLPDGATAIVCGSRNPQRCLWCNQPGTLLCDHPAPWKRSGTCDRPVCAGHAKHVGPDRHHCPAHL